MNKIISASTNIHEENDRNWKVELAKKLTRETICMQVSNVYILILKDVSS